MTLAQEAIKSLESAIKLSEMLNGENNTLLIENLALKIKLSSAELKIKELELEKIEMRKDFRSRIDSIHTGNY